MNLSYKYHATFVSVCDLLDLWDVSGLGKNPSQKCRFIECLALELFCILYLHYNLYNSRHQTCYLTLPDLKVGESFTLMKDRAEQQELSRAGLRQ